jgi:3-hydroxyisobutyrate dehydrogenase-like beta-hydroxyacid dehydrogenase
MTEPTFALAFIGFGEAACAFAQGIDRACLTQTTAFDKKTADPATRAGMALRYKHFDVVGCDALAPALNSADLIMSLVTADQAGQAAMQAAQSMPEDALFLDCNSCSPASKITSAKIIDDAGGRYVDVAVMAPVQPAGHQTALLLSGQYAAEAETVLSSLAMKPSIVNGPIGVASSNKMVRSIVIKGFEATIAECVLAGTRAGVSDMVLASLEKTYPNFQWPERARYVLERMINHGNRRAAEMVDVAQTVEDLDLPGTMAAASIAWQARIGSMELNAEGKDYQELAQEILSELDRDQI